MKVTTILRRILPIIGFLILLYLVQTVGVNRVISTFLRISPFYILISAVLTFPRIFLRAFAWLMICKEQRIDLSYLDCVKILLIGYLYAIVTPSYVGHLVRIPYVKELTDEPAGKIFTNVLIEVILRSISLYILMVIGSIIVMKDNPSILYAVAAYVAIAISIYWFFSKEKRGKRALKFFAERIVPRERKKWSLQVIDSFYKDFPKLRKLIVPSVIGMITWMLTVAQFYIIALSLEINVSYYILLVFFPIANAAGYLPITSGGFGTREAAFVALLSLFDIPAEKSIVLSISGFIVADILTGLYGSILSFLEGMRNKSAS